MLISLVSQVLLESYINALASTVINVPMVTTIEDRHVYGAR